MLCLLMAAADESDREKIVYIYTAYHDDMIKFAKHRLRNAGVANCDGDAEDVVQNTFLKIVRNIDTVDTAGGDKKLRAYLLTIVANEVLDLVGDRDRFDEIESYDDVPSDDDFVAALETRERYAAVVSAIKRMNEKYSTVMYYRYCREMSIAEIAALTGISEKAVYARIARGKRILLKTLAKEGAI